MHSLPLITRWVAIASLITLIALVGYWNLSLSPPRAAPVAVVLALFLLPLIAVLPGMLLGRTGAFIAAALVSLIYLTHAIVDLSSGAERSWPAVAEAGLALALLISASLRSRWQRMEEAGQTPADP